MVLHFRNTARGIPVFSEDQLIPQEGYDRKILAILKTMTLKLQHTLKNITSPLLLEPKQFSHQCMENFP